MTSDRDNLEPIEPSTARDLYLDHKATECANSTVRNYRYALKSFVTWCGNEDIDNLNVLTGRHLHQFRVWRKEDGDLAPMTLRTQMSGLRVFLQWAGSIEAVPEDLYQKVMIPRVPREERRRTEMLESDRAQETLDYLAKFHYASIEHAVFAVFWETGMRLGAVVSLDVGDVDLEDDVLYLVHRPDQGTTLKNGKRGERPIAIRSQLATLLEDYIENTRSQVTDEYGRQPLFTASSTRRHRTSIRRIVYRVTAPCFQGKQCPDCADDPDLPCPEAVNPHAIRRGSITHFLTEDVPIQIVGDRMDVSREVLEEHYDKRSEEIKLEQRRSYLDNV